MRYFNQVLVVVLLLTSGVTWAKSADVSTLPNSAAPSMTGSDPYAPLTGMVKQVDAGKNQIEVLDDMGKTLTITLDPASQLTRDGRDVTLAQLNPGDHIVVNSNK